MQGSMDKGSCSAGLYGPNINMVPTIFSIFILLANISQKISSECVPGPWYYKQTNISTQTSTNSKHFSLSLKAIFPYTVVAKEYFPSRSPISLCSNMKILLFPCPVGPSRVSGNSRRTLSEEEGGCQGCPDHFPNFRWENRLEIRSLKTCSKALYVIWNFGGLQDQAQW